MARLIGLRVLLCAAIAIVCSLGAGAAQAKTLRLVTKRLLPYDNLDNKKAPGLSVEVLRQVFAAMRQDASIESVPYNRGFTMVARGEADGIFTVFPTSKPSGLCSFPDEPLGQTRYVLFIRAADIGKLKFSSFNDLVGHDVAVRGPPPGLFAQPTVSPDMWKFLREHHTMVETDDGAENLRMLAAGRVDYAVVSLSSGMAEISEMGLSGKIEPLLSRNVMVINLYVCFTKARVSPAFVDAFSHALKQFKQTGAYQAIYHKYFP
jgi:polar amino acid transport system substrate-binding protein